MAFSFGASASPQQQQQQQMPTDPNQLMAMMFQQMMQQQQQPQPQQQGPDLSALLAQLRNDPQGDANRSYMPGKGGVGSPWADPLQFRSVDQMQQDMAGYGPAVGIPGRTDAATNPYAFGAISTTPDPATPWQGGVNPTLRNASGGMFEGMINPALPDAQKYGDANMFGIQPGISSLQGNEVLGNENGPQYVRPELPTPATTAANSGRRSFGKPKKKAARSPLSGFKLGA